MIPGRRTFYKTKVKVLILCQCCMQLLVVGIKFVVVWFNRRWTLFSKHTHFFRCRVTRWPKKASVALWPGYRIGRTFALLAATRSGQRLFVGLFGLICCYYVRVACSCPSLTWRALPWHLFKFALSGIDQDFLEKPFFLYSWLSGTSFFFFLSFSTSLFTWVVFKVS